MNLSFLGDALDHWKGSLLELLQNAKALEDLSVDPMASDLDSWEESDFLLYARLLKISPGQILRHSNPLSSRRAYFAEITHRGDLFMDPDTGVATGKIRNRKQYISPIEVGHLLPAESPRLPAIYQHVRAQRVAKRVDAVLDVVTREIGSFSWSSYESGTVAMLFLSRDKTRIERLARLFKKVLGRHAEGRIKQGERT